MSDPSEAKVKELFQQALEKPESERAAFIERVCGGNEELQRRVEALLAAHGDAGVFLSEATDERHPSPPGPVPAPPPLREQPGDMIGPYKLLQEIGEGGFGVVYMAQQTEPVRRKVALKIIRLGMDTEQVIARFEAERQALAIMDHPNIARVLDAGATATGRPYFVMELVKGITITEYCDQAQLDTVQRLQLFQDVCHAVQHAHHKGVIHRDIKPGNILVTLHDGRPVPKVIDFGIAKATDRQLTQRTIFTEFRQMIGTPEYMSPEQAELSGLDIDTRADVYSLGVVLYELLTGTKPFDLQTLLSRGFDEILRTIREVEPQKPSTRISTMGDELPTVAQKRHTPPKMLGRLLRGDLDWIVMKSLEKDRTRRYETPDGLARDIQRFLDDEPVLASPPGRLYRARKFVRRHRIGVFAGVVVVLALLAGGALAVSGYLDAQASAEDARHEAQHAKEEAARANTVFALVRDMLRSANPWNRTHETTLREVLENFDRGFDAALIEAPEAEAAIRGLLAESYLSLELPDKARPHIERALEIRRRTLGTEHPTYARMLYHRGALRFLEGRFAEAERDIQEAAQTLERCYGKTHWTVIQAWSHLGRLLDATGRDKEAEQVARRALAAAQEADRTDWIATCQDILCEIVQDLGDHAQAESLARQALATKRAHFGEGHAQVAAAIDQLGGVLFAAGRVDDAVQLYKDALERVRANFGEDHVQTAKTLSNLANALRMLGKAKEARELAHRALAIAEKHWGEDHFRILSLLNLVGVVLSTAGDRDAASRTFGKALAISRRLGSSWSSHPTLLANQATALWELGKREEALELWREALTWYREHLDDEGPALATTHYELGFRMKELDRLDDAQEHLGRALEIYRARLGEDHWRAAWALLRLGEVAHKRGDEKQAEELLRKAFAIGAKHTSRRGTAPYALNVLQTATNTLGDWLNKARRLEESEAVYRACIAALKAGSGGGDRETGAYIHSLAHILEEQNRPEEAIRAYEEAITKHHDNDKERLEDLTCLWKLVARLRRFEPGLEVLSKLIEVRTKLFGAEHPTVAEMHFHRANLLDFLKRPKEAEQAHKASFSILCRAVAGKIEDPSHLKMFHLVWPPLGERLRNAHRPKEAEAVFRRGIEALRTGTGGGDRNPHALVHELGHALADQGRDEEAERCFRDALAGGPQQASPERAHNAQCLMLFFIDRKRYADALPASAIMVEGLRGAQPLRLATALRLHGWCCLEQGQPEKALRALEEARALRAKHDPNGWQHWILYDYLGRTLTKLKRFEEAEKALLTAWEKLHPPAHLMRVRNRVPQRLVELYEAWNKPDRAQEWRKKTPPKKPAK